MEKMTFEVFDILVKRYKNIEKLWDTDPAKLRQNIDIPVDVIDELVNEKYKKNLSKFMEYMNDNDIKMINCYEQVYPWKLKLIENRPIVLFYKGDISAINNESVAIVGSRCCTEYGRKSGQYFAFELARREINIISGLAIGIDSVAHCSALNAKGKTFAVIGNGLDNIYPAQNKILAEKIIENGGAIISEYVVGTKPNKKNFPRRNRIISGISNAVIVVEAGEKSGTLITANYAINQGKDVWVVPGSIFSEQSKGTNALIKDGANMLTSIKDIIRNS